MQTRIPSRARRALEAPETDAGGGSLARSAVERGGGQGLSLRKPDRLARGVLTTLSAARSSCSWYGLRDILPGRELGSGRMTCVTHDSFRAAGPLAPRL